MRSPVCSGNSRRRPASAWLTPRGPLVARGRSLGISARSRWVRALWTLALEMLATGPRAERPDSRPSIRARRGEGCRHH